MPLLQVTDLRVGFRFQGGVHYAVDGVSLHVAAGETLGVVGESGSGKTSLGQALLRSSAKADAPHVTGQALFDGRDLLRLSDSELRALRGREISMVLQDPTAALNPVLTIGDQVAEAIACHTRCEPAELRRRVIHALERMRIAEPASRIDDYPHQLSGGMRQRVAGAIALAHPPRLLIADEPTTSLDVTVQAQYLDLLAALQRQFEMALLLITHDFGVIARSCDRVCVMYAGQLVESAPVRALFQRPKHWYTAALIASIPKRSHKAERLVSIPGVPVTRDSVPAACRFAPRCPNAQERCTQQAPPLTRVDAQHELRCWYPVTQPTLTAAQVDARVIP